MKGIKRHHASYRLLRILLLPFFWLIFHYRFTICRPQKRPCLILSNHATMLDPFFAAMSFPDPMYFVASEHIFRWGWISKLLHFLLAPVARLRATTEAGTVLRILRLLKEGQNVCIFPEGCCTFDGRTGRIDGTIGKLVKKSGVTLITYQLHGGYLMRPRWARHTRHGPTSGKMVAEYAPEVLSQMSVAEINALIRRDLFVDAYAQQRKHPRRYRGRALAEGLPLALYRCPHCGAVGTLTATENEISCCCGLSAALNDQGFFINRMFLSFETVAEWMDWQRSCAEELANQTSPVCTAENLKLMAHERKQSGCVVSTGRLTLFVDRITFADDKQTHTFLFSDFSELAAHSKNTLLFSLDGTHYELKLPEDHSALPYLDLFDQFHSRTV